MPFRLNKELDDAAGEKSRLVSSSDFSVSLDPVVSDDATPLVEPDLPTTYGTETLCLMARDPRTLFAYWDVDWAKIFGDNPPPDRTVHLLVRRSTEAEGESTAVEPMAGSSYVSVKNSDDSYVAELGYFQPAAVWNSVATSDVVMTPADHGEPVDPGDFATIPFHLSFQRMLDSFEEAHREGESLAAKLNELHERAQTPGAHLSEQEKELARVLNEVASSEPTPPRNAATAAPDLWATQKIQKILGLGDSSQGSGFAGSSRAR